MDGNVELIYDNQQILHRVVVVEIPLPDELLAVHYYRILHYRLI